MLSDSSVSRYSSDSSILDLLCLRFSLPRNLSCLFLRNQNAPPEPCCDTQESSEFRTLFEPELMEECCRKRTIESMESVWLDVFLSTISFSRLSSVLFHMTCFSLTDGSLFFCLPRNFLRSGEAKKLSIVELLLLLLIWNVDQSWCWWLLCSALLPLMFSVLWELDRSLIIETKTGITQPGLLRINDNNW